MKIFVLFSGHNDRAVVALCRFFHMYSLPFVIVSSGRADAIRKTDWRSNVIISRIDRQLDISLFRVISQCVREMYGSQASFVYCPTTEFANHFVLQERAVINQLGWILLLPEQDVYAKLTSKFYSQKIIENFVGVSVPEELAWSELQIPCVLKPRENIGAGEVHYPQLCRNAEELQIAIKNCDPKKWFPQRWVEGQSFYLCAYLAKDGRVAHFWQQNLLQQPGGKSMVLARSVCNPGLDITALFEGLKDMDYYGPFMMEVIQDEAGKFYYIEVNPRFWGPLQLALDTCPDILRLFAYDAGFLTEDSGFGTVAVEDVNSKWYAWKHGAKAPNCRQFPALMQMSQDEHLESLISHWDVYGKPDTMQLHGVY